MKTPSLIILALFLIALLKVSDNIFFIDNESSNQADLIIEMAEAMETMGYMIVTNNIIRREHDLKIQALQSDMRMMMHDIELHDREGHRYEDY